MLCNSVIIVGCLVYVSAGMIGSIDAVILAQFCIGFGAGSLGVTRSYISEVTTKADKMVYMAYVSAFQYCGFAVSPILGALISYWNKEDRILPAGEHHTFINEFSAPAFFLMFMATVCILSLYTVFYDMDRAKLSSDAPVPSQTKTQRADITDINKSNETITLLSTSDSANGESYSGSNSKNETILEAKFMEMALIDRVTLGCCLLNIAMRGISEYL
jgi:MFS family permease